MKIKGFLITGIIFAVCGIGMTAVASTQIDFNEEMNGLFSDPTLEEKEQTFGEIVKIHYDGADENIDIIYQEGENSFTYYEGKNVSYEIQYDEDQKELFILQNRTFTFFNFCINRKKAVLSVNSPLEGIEIHAAAGNIGLKDLTAFETTLDVNAGNLKIENSDFSKLNIESSAGNVNLSSVRTDIGKIEVRAGNLKIENSGISNATLLANAGNVRIVASIFTTLYAKLNAGNLSLTGDILTYGELMLDAGNMNMSLARSKGLYTINGDGSGDTQILYKVSAGKVKVIFSE